jgi:hypothetical protein
MQDEHLVVLREILKWIRVEALPSVRATLEGILQKQEHRRLYQSLDGSRTQTQLSSKSGISQPTISRLVAAWQRSGIVEEKSPGKYKKLFDLEELGIQMDKEGE